MQIENEAQPQGGEEPVNALEEAVEVGQEAEAPQDEAYTDEPVELEEPQAPARNYEAEQEARKYGWRPKEDYTNDPKGWVDAERFLKLPTTEIKRMRDERKAERAAFDSRMANLERMNKAAMESQKQAYQSQIDDLTHQQRIAVQTADTEAYDRLEKQKQTLVDQQQATQAAPQQEGPDPFVQSYVATNQWAQNPVLWQQAVQIVDANPAIRGATAQQQVEYAEQQIKAMYPQMFQDEAPKPQPRPRQQRVDGGGLARGGKQASQSAKLPAEAKRQGQAFVDQGIFKDMEAYAKAYFEEGN